MDSRTLSNQHSLITDRIFRYIFTKRPQSPSHNISNVSNVFYKGHESFPHDSTLLAIEGGITSSGAILNLCFFAVIILIKRMETTKSNHYIASLVLADFLMCTSLLLFRFVIELQGIELFSVCDVRLEAIVFMGTAAAFSRFAIAIDRYIYIVDPLRYYQRITASSVYFILFCVWLSASVIGFEPLVYAIYDTDYIWELCDKNPSPQYIVLVLVLAILTPALVVLLIYLRIFYWAILQIHLIREVKSAYSQIQFLEDDPEEVRRSSAASRLLGNLTPSNSSILSSKDTTGFESGPSGRTADVDSISLSLGPSRKSVSVIVPLVHTSKDNKPWEKLHTEKGERPKFSINSGNKEEHFRPPPILRQERMLSTIEDKYEDTPSSALTETVLDTAQTLPSSQASPSGRPSINSSESDENRMTDHEKKRLSPTYSQRTFISINSTTSLKLALTKMLGKSELKAAAVIVAVCGSFLICWAPLAFVTIWKLSSPGSVSTHVQLIALLIAYFNCVLDPLVYAVFNKPFRMAVVKYYRRYRRRIVKS